MNNKVTATIEKHGMLSYADKVIVALSGGADSVCLLHILLELRERYNISVIAAHVNHKLRGAESERDEAFVKELCESLNVELFVEGVDVNALCQQTGESFELAGRRVRYDFFNRLCISEKATRIATAHTASDAVETALLSMARGTSLKGICSIPYTRGNIIRPLLDVTRQEVEEYAKENNLNYVTDSTNLDANICNRNKIRHLAVPALKDVNGAFESNFIRLRQQLTEIDSFMVKLAKQAVCDAKIAYGYDANKLCALEPALKSYAIVEILKEKGVGYEQKHIEEISEALVSKQAVVLPKGYVASCSQGVFRIEEKSSVLNGEIQISLDKTVCVGAKEYSFSLVKCDDNVYKKLSSSVLGCDKITSAVVLRTRRQGDRFSLIKRKVTKDLRKLQNELKIPSELRDELLLIAEGNKVLWAEGIGVSADGECTGEEGILIKIKGECDYA